MKARRFQHWVPNEAEVVTLSHLPSATTLIQDPSFSVSSFSSLSKTSNPLLADFLINTLHFSQTEAFTFASMTRFSKLKSLERPQAVLEYFRNLGFSKQHIHSSVRLCPQILTSHVDNTLKPKILFFQQLGLPSSHLGNFFFKSPFILALSLHKNLVPTIEILSKIFVNDKNNQDLFKGLSNSTWLIISSANNYKLLPNIRFLQSCGIVGSQLAMLLRWQPRLFSKQEAELKNLVSRVSNLGFNINSRMFVHALFAASCYSVKTFETKVQTFESFGFSKDEYMEMFRKCPSLLSNSTEKSITGLDFYLNTVKLRKEVIISNPVILRLSMENRVIPRYKVLQSIMSKQLLKKKQNFETFVKLSEVVFMEKFILNFPDHAEQLLIVYKGHNLNPYSQEELSTS